MKQLLKIFALSILIINSSCAQKSTASGKAREDGNIIPGAEKTEEYIPWLKGKRVAVFANQTSMVGKTHLVDTLIKSGIKVSVIFGPEHGFRGDADAGEKVGNYIDKKTGIPVVSLYGGKRAPSAEDLKNVDIMIFDIQDVGVRFYTYITSMQFYLESAIINNKPFLLLDRPNPNGHYVDGPVLDTAFKSFIGMQPIPVVYGMTMAEYANMLIGERWLSKEANKQLDFLMAARCREYECFTFRIVNNGNYTHKSMYKLPVAPSPNLREMQSIYLYPSTCFFEGTVLSEGRGTDKPFQIFGHPTLPKHLYSFTPKPNAGAKSSKCFYQKCYGWNLSGSEAEVLKKVNNAIQLSYLKNAYQLFPGKDTFFLKNNFINKLAGTDELAKQIKSGDSETKIKQSWKSKIDAFKIVRKKYLLYEDFE